MSFFDKDVEWFKNNILLFNNGIPAGIFISELDRCNEAVKRHFHCEYVYQIQMNALTCNTNKMTGMRLQSLKMDKSTLVNIIRDHRTNDAYFELFSSWADDEGEPRNMKKDKTINLDQLESADYLVIEDRQYIMVIV